MICWLVTFMIAASDDLQCWLMIDPGADAAADELLVIDHFCYSRVSGDVV